ncbi:hypothetical protein [Vibrio astriarenae]|uniref:hypothetical protein n=1 Tax=Vibrio astriarenae TaxID=1481923 RepID=UPI003734EDDC
MVGYSFAKSILKSGLIVSSIIGFGQVSASDLVDFNEQIRLNEITSSFQEQYDEIGLESSVLMFNELNASIESSKIKLINNIDIIKSDVDQMQSKLMQGEYDDSLVLMLRKASSNVASLRKELAQSEATLIETEAKIKVSESSIKQLERAKNDDLLALYEDIKTRHVKKSNQILSEDFSGQLSCNVTDSLSACMNRNLPSMKNAFILKNGGLERVEIVDFTVVDATQKLNGDLTYAVNANFKHVYSPNTEIELRKALGLEKVRFTLASNSKDTVFYINERRVGGGETVDVSGNYVGVYNVKAVNGAQTQSLRLDLENQGEYFFPFKVSSKVAPAKKNPTETKNEVVAKKQNVNQENMGFYSNTVLHSDSAFSYLSPVLHRDNKELQVFLGQNSALEFCEDKFSSALASEEAYRYLQSQVKLIPGDYWLANGRVYSSEEQAVVKKTFETNRFVCMVNM